MSSGWLDNDDAKNRVKQLLTEAGLPLELSVEANCRTFVSSGQTTHPDFSFSSARLVYAGYESDKPPREVDQCVAISTEVDLNQSTIIQLFLMIPIECKYRANLEVFGFPYPGPSGKSIVSQTAQRRKRRPALRFLKGFPRSTATYPMLTVLIGSRFANRLEKSAYSLITCEPVSAVSFLEIEGGQTPSKVHKENIAYKAGAALYDYIHHDAYPMSRHDIGHTVERALGEESLKSLDELYRLLNLSHDLRYKWHRVLDFIDDQVDIADFNRCFYDRDSTLEGLAVAFSVFIYFPIVCLDSKLYLVEMDPDGRIAGFAEKRLLVTKMRVPSWPGSFQGYAVVPAREGLLAITNPVGLSYILDSLLEWFDSLVETLKRARKEEIERLAVEASIFNYIIGRSRQQEPA